MNTQSTRWLVLGGVMLTLCSSASNAEILYSQTMPEEPGAAFGSINSSTAPRLADNFLFEGTEAKTIRSVRVIGSPLAAQDTLPLNSFRVVFFGTESGLPGSTLPEGDFSITDGTLQRFTNGRLLNGVGVPVEYWIDLGDGIQLEPNTEYWISVSNRPNSTDSWAWARAGGLFDQQIATTLNTGAPDLWTISGSGGGMWFELRTTNIPEPGGFILCVAGLLAISRFAHSR